MMDDCILWHKAPNRDGYGRTRADGREPLAHRHIYEECLGQVPDGLELDHLCRNRLCVNPNHLEPVTHKQNLERGPGAKTHCINGHLLDEANTYISAKRGTRQCRTCRRIQSERQSRERKQARWERKFEFSL